MKTSKYISAAALVLALAASACKKDFLSLNPTDRIPLYSKPM
jgi:hypothetical protein